MSSLLEELTNLADRSTVAGDKLAAKVCLGAIQEIKWLQTEVAFWLGEGKETRPEVIELQTLTKMSSLNEKQTLRIRELCEMFDREYAERPELIADIERLEAELAERTKVARYITCCLGGAGDDSEDGWDPDGIISLFGYVCREWPWCDPRNAAEEKGKGES